MPITGATETSGDTPHWLYRKAKAGKIDAAEARSHCWNSRKNWHAARGVGTGEIEAQLVVPLHLKNVCIPPQRIAEFSGFNRFHKTRQIDDRIRQVAWHETGHAVAWTLNGGTVDRL